MNSPVLLEWDTAHFGFPIGKTDWEGDWESLKNVVRVAKGSGLTLLYVFSPAQTCLPQDILETCVSVFESTRVEYVKRVIGEEIIKEKEGHYSIVSLNPANCDINRIRELSVIAGRFSRFLNDPLIPRYKGEELFRIWGEESVRGTLADVVFGVRNSDRSILGFVTAKQSGARGQIGLIAVDPIAQKSGLGAQLLTAISEWGASKRLKELRVVTQGENLPACRFYVRHGFSPIQWQKVWHLWLRYPDPNVL